MLEPGDVVGMVGDKITKNVTLADVSVLGVVPTEPFLTGMQYLIMASSLINSFL